MPATFDNAVKKAVKAYYEGSNFDSYEKASGAKVKYNIDYFDDIEGSYKRKASKAKPVDEEIEEEGEVAEEDEALDESELAGLFEDTE